MTEIKQGPPPTKTVTVDRQVANDAENLLVRLLARGRVSIDDGESFHLATTRRALSEAIERCDTTEPVTEGPPYSKQYDQVLDALDGALREKLGVEPEGDAVSVDYEAISDIEYALVAAVLPLIQRHDSDCQANDNTYVHQGEPGLFPHGNRNGRHFAADAIGTNGRRILLRDDLAGIYVGGALLDPMTALNLAGLLRDWSTDAIARAAGVPFTE